MRLVPVVAALLALALPASAQDRAALERDIEKAVERLYSEKGNESDVAREELTAIGRRAAPRLVQELTGKAPGDRKPNARVRRLLCEILGAIRDNSPAVLDALADRLNDTEEHGLSVAAASAWALGEIADERSIPPLVKAINSKAAESDRWLRHSCIEALGILRAKDAVPALLKAAEDKGAAELGGYDKRHLLRADAADALGLIGAKEAVEPLGKLLTDTELNPSTQLKVSVHAARALERILATSKGALTGSGVEIESAVAAWKKWWTTEETKKNVEKVKGQLAEISGALERFKKQYSKYPEILDYLKTKPVGDEYKDYPAGGFYSGELKDPWGKQIFYSAKAENGAPFDLISFGRDGASWGGGDDADIWNHESYIPIRIQKTRDAIKQIEDAIAKLKADGGKPPGSIVELTKPPTDATKNQGKPYLEKLPKDGFDGNILYTLAGTKDVEYDLKSLGSDRREGGAGIARDIWNHDKWIPERVEKTKEHLKAVGDAIEKFRKEQDRLPEELDNMKTQPTWAKKALWPPGGYGPSKLLDPFGNALVYTPSKDGKTFELKSVGADGAEGGTGADADLTYGK
jgi:HEAT repeat protein